MANNVQDGNQGGGRRGRKQDVDLSSDPNFLWRFFKQLVSGFANDLGQRGFDAGVVNAALKIMDDKLGPTLTGLAIQTTAAIIQNPEFIKQTIRSLKWPEQINSLIDEFIDDAFEGLRMAFLSKGKVTQADAGQALQQALGRFGERLDQMTFAESMQHLTPEEQALLSQRIAAFGENADNKARFDAWRKKINRPRILKTLLKLPLGDWPGYLEQLFGAVEPPKKSWAGKAWDRLEREAQELLRTKKEPDAFIPLQGKEKESPTMVAQVRKAIGEHSRELDDDADRRMRQADELEADFHRKR